MEKIVMVLKVENSVIKVNSVTSGEKEVSKATIIMTDGKDKFVAEAFDKVAEGVKNSNLEGKLCNVDCQLSVNKGKESSRLFNSIRVLSIKSLFETHDEYLNEEKGGAGNG